MEERYMVAVDLGTINTAIAVARVEGKTVNVIHYREYPSEGIKRSGVNNESTVAAVLATAKAEAEKAFDIKIKSALVGMPRFPVRLVDWKSEISLNGDEDITQEDVKSLMNIAREDCSCTLDEKEAVYGIITQSYSDGEEFQIREDEVIGLERESIEGYYKIAVGRKNLMSRIDKVFAKVDMIPIKCFTAESTASAVLSRSERETGVALVEIGGGATSVSIYTDNVLRYYGSIPFGGKIVTEDIRQECAIGGNLAENIKKGYGVCLPGRLQTLADKKLQIRSNNSCDDRQIAVKLISEIITARMEEICDAALYLIQESGLYDELRSGIVLTGGGACQANVANLFAERSGYGVKLGYPSSGFDFSGEEMGSHDPGAACIMGMLMAGMQMDIPNCAEYAPRESFADVVKSAVKAGSDTKAKPEVPQEEGDLFDKETEKSTETEEKEPENHEHRWPWQRSKKREKPENADKAEKTAEKPVKKPQTKEKDKSTFDNLKVMMGSLFADDGSEENMA